MHIIKITPNLIFEYQCTSGKFIRLPNRKNRFGSENRIETFLPELECSSKQWQFLVTHFSTTCNTAASSEKHRSGVSLSVLSGV